MLKVKLKQLKKKIKEQHVDDLVMYQNYCFDVSLVIRSKKPLSSYVYEINLGFLEDEFKENNYFYVSLNTNEIKNYIKREVEKLPITYMFNTKPISFYVYFQFIVLLNI